MFQIDRSGQKEKGERMTDIIKFGMWITGHDQNTVEQLYKDWFQSEYSEYFKTKNNNDIDIMPSTTGHITNHYHKF